MCVASLVFYCRCTQMQKTLYAQTIEKIRQLKVCAKWAQIGDM